MIKQLLLQLVLILLNAFFAATEIAVISLNEKKVRAMAEEGDKKARKMLKIIEEPTRFLSTIQVGITLAGFLGSAFAADNFATRLSAFLVGKFEIQSLGLISTIENVSVILITLILSYFTLVFGELVPKRLAMKYKEKLANGVCGIISGITTVLRPVIWFLSASTNLVLRIFRIDPNEKEETVSEEDIVIMLDAGADEGTLNQDDIEYIKNVFKLDKMAAQDIMTSRGSLVAIPEDIEESELLELIKNERYSRLPVYSESIDKIVGIIHIRDYLLNRTEGEFNLADMMYKPVYVPETARLDSLLKEMQDEHNHMVVVIDEYGSTAGIVTMEDILEELVGEIWDEQDEEVHNIVELSENTYRVLSGMSIEEFFEFFSLEWDEDIESTTVNGWLTELCGIIPPEGHSVEYKNLSVTVAKADDLMTHELTVIYTPVSEDEDGEEAEGEE